MPDGRGPQFSWVWDLYNFTHSALMFALIFGRLWLILRRPVLEMLGWALHIVIDVFTLCSRSASCGRSGQSMWTAEGGKRAGLWQRITVPWRLFTCCCGFGAGLAHTPIQGDYFVVRRIERWFVNERQATGRSYRNPIFQREPPLLSNGDYTDSEIPLNTGTFLPDC